MGVYKLIYKILLGMNCFALNKNTKAYQSVRFRFGYDNNEIDIDIISYKSRLDCKLKSK